MIRYFCDVCDNEIEDMNMKQLELKMEDIAQVPGKFYNNAYHIMLCPSCVKKLNNLLETNFKFIKENSNE